MKDLVTPSGEPDYGSSTAGGTWTLTNSSLSRTESTLSPEELLREVQNSILMTVSTLVFKVDKAVELINEAKNKVREVQYKITSEQPVKVTYGPTSNRKEEIVTGNLETNRKLGWYARLC